VEGRERIEKDGEEKEAKGAEKGTAKGEEGIIIIFPSSSLLSLGIMKVTSEGKTMSCTFMIRVSRR